MAIVNFESTKTGKVRAICSHCDRKSKAVEPNNDGQPSMFGLSGWSCAPYFATTEHADSSVGSKWTCPSCKKLRDQRQRDGIRPLLAPTAERQAVLLTVVWCSCGHTLSEHGKYFKQRPCNECACPDICTSVAGYTPWPRRA